MQAGLYTDVQTKLDILRVVESSMTTASGELKESDKREVTSAKVAFQLSHTLPGIL